MTTDFPFNASMSYTGPGVPLPPRPAGVPPQKPVATGLVLEPYPPPLGYAFKPFPMPAAQGGLPWQPPAVSSMSREIKSMEVFMDTRFDPSSSYQQPHSPPRSPPVCNDCSDKDRMIDEQAKEIEDLRTRKNEYQFKVSDVCTELVNANNLLQDRELENVRLKTLVDEQSSGKRRAELLLNAACTEIKSLKATLDEEIKQREYTEELYMDLKPDNTKLAAENAELKEKNARLMRDVTRIPELQSDLQKERGRNRELLQEIEDAEAQLDFYRNLNRLQLLRADMVTKGDYVAVMGPDEEVWLAAVDKVFKGNKIKLSCYYVFDEKDGLVVDRQSQPGVERISAFRVLKHQPRSSDQWVEWTVDLKRVMAEDRDPINEEAREERLYH